MSGEDGDQDEDDDDNDEDDVSKERKFQRSMKVEKRCDGGDGNDLSSIGKEGAMDEGQKSFETNS